MYHGRTPNSYKSSKNGKKPPESSNLRYDISLNYFADSTISGNPTREPKSGVMPTSEIASEFRTPLPPIDTVPELAVLDSAPPGPTDKFVLWTCLADYIRPEDVGRFAAICRLSRAAVNNVSFWRSLYQRHYTRTTSLPHTLDIANISKAFAIRANVIRALYYIYPPFKNRISTHAQDRAQTLIGHHCMVMWHKQDTAVVPGNWTYYFKFEQRFKAKHPQSVMDYQNAYDIWANTERNCRVLVATCKLFVPVVCVEGLVLTSAGYHLCSNLRDYKLQLKFGTRPPCDDDASTRRSMLDGGQYVKTVTLSPVGTLQLLDWWRPQYPRAEEVQQASSDECIDLYWGTD